MQPPLSKESGQSRDKMWRSISGSSGTLTTQIGSREISAGCSKAAVILCRDFAVSAADYTRGSNHGVIN
jgi:hypothetical protein